jgi:PBSX family phage terminase large subunit
MTKELGRDSVVVCGEHCGGIAIFARIESIKFRKRDFYWDFNVRGTPNYMAHGFINHNSTKSSFVSTCIPLLMEMNPRLHCVCFRKFGTNLADSVYAQFEFTINEKLRPIANNWVFKRSPLKIIRERPNGQNQQILFRGLDDPQKVKSLKAPFGYFGLIWMEELAEFDGIEEVRNVLQSLRRGGHYFQTFCSYNPPETTANWVNYEASVPQIVDGKLYRYVHHSDYRGVPREWLGDDFFVTAELLGQTNERAYRHEYLGEVTGNGGAVFPNVVPMEMSDELIATFDSRRFGLDFGFALDPLHYSASHYDKKHRDLYIFDEINELNCTNIALAELLKAKKEEIGFNYIMCDAAEPKSIAELEGLGVNCLAAQKGPDSRRFSYRFLQSLAHIFIDPKRCPKTYESFVQCEYLKNKAGQFISRYPENGGDDPIDSVRYAIMDDAIDAGLF